jgi:integrase
LGRWLNRRIATRVLAIVFDTGRVVRLLALTGMRLGEVRTLKWDWLDLEHLCFRLAAPAA